MVFQDELLASRWWPFVAKNWPRGDQKKPSSVDTSSEERDALDLADVMEKGKMHEFTEDFVRPVQNQPRLHRFCVKRSVDRLQYRLYSDSDQAFIMYAAVRSENQEVHFFLYDPDDKESLFDPDRPVFKMTFNPSKTEWLVSHFQDGTWYSPRQATNMNFNRRAEEVAFIQHSQIEVGEGVNHCLEANIARTEVATDGATAPTQQSDGQHSRVIERLVTRQAVWNEEIQTLVLDFRGRDVIPSSKNFQVACEGRPERVVLQHGKIAKNTFALDFRFPLSISQAFAMAISTVFWE
jgi:hypothetical protein